MMNFQLNTSKRQTIIERFSVAGLLGKSEKYYIICSFELQIRTPGT